MTHFACDLAFSAVGSDAGLVAELIAEIGGRLRTAPAWQGDLVPMDAGATAVLGAEHSRVAAVLHQQLWLHDEQTQGEALVLRERLRGRRGSVCVIALDDAPLPGWLSPAPHYNVSAGGRAGVAEFVIQAITAAGGSVKVEPPRPSESETASRWPEPPAPFLAQPRAQSALRHELDAIIGELRSVVERSVAAQPERVFELQVLPHRMVARLDDVAVSFSWVTGRFGTVADGRLLVMAWRHVASGVKGPAALKSATVIRERVYAVDALRPDEWRWRADDVTGQPYSTTDLAAEWMARAHLERSQ